MWDSDVTRWNIKKTFGRDTMGELEKAIKARGMVFMVSFHHAYSWRYYERAYEFDAGVPGNEDLYCVPHTPDERQDHPKAKGFCEAWLVLHYSSIDG
jgi:alpha-L-fucosidase